MFQGGKGGVRLFLIWVGFGFLFGLTGSVVMAPRFSPQVEESVPLVYNTGLQPAAQPAQGTSNEPAAAGNKEGQATNNPQKQKKEGEIFSSRGCIQCHEVTAYGLKGGVTGPDLSIAYKDVPNRFGKSLKEFLWNPEGTMGEIIPGKGITEAEKQEILDLLTKVANPPAPAGDKSSSQAGGGGSGAPSTPDKGGSAPAANQPAGGGDGPGKK